MINKTPLTVMIFALVLLFSISIVSADLFSWITGKATTQNVNLNVSVANNPPQVTLVFPNLSIVTPSEAGTILAVFNFSVYDADGYAGINDASAKINATRGTQSARLNTTCLRYEQNGNNANYTCTIPMWYFDEAGEWNLTASITDVNSATATNTSFNFTYSSLTAFVRGPATITFSTITAGATNTTSNNDPILLNNTGNYPVTAGNVLVNATDLKGETTPSQIIFAKNMSVGTQTGSLDECGATGSNIMNRSVFQTISTGALPRGNYTVNDGSTGHEQMYACIIKAGSELTSQAYSTASEGAWTIKIQ